MTGPVRRPRGRPRTVDRARAVELAMLECWEHGLSAFSLNELCKRAGLSKPALYREFGGEDGLFAAALDHYRQRVSLPLLARLDTDAGFRPALDAAIVGLTTDRDTPAGCLFTKMRLASPRLGPLAAEGVHKLASEHLRAYEAWFCHGVASGEANADVPAKLAARYIDTQFATALVQMGMGVAPALVRAQARLAVQPLLAESRAGP
ncbi:MAG: TetR/AcrR family transcriptional regulator [Myxococcales bacterium FL481]|nr:MAG: TetR/AcrR family transcriptional regulator [Myxococcales bacterium FL481]